MRRRATILSLVMGLTVLSMGSPAHAQAQSPTEAKKANVSKDLAAIDQVVLRNAEIVKTFFLEQCCSDVSGGATGFPLPS